MDFTDKKGKVEKHHHHILPNSMVLWIGMILMILTAVTVWVAHFDLGHLNFVVAMLIASIKGSLVALFFMNLKYDRKENGVIFATSFLFLAIFIVLTATDLFFRGDVYVKGPWVAAAQTQSKIKDPWIGTPELIAQGKALFSQQCVACHGSEGKGDGPAAGALNPHPRNFTFAENWKNGRKPSGVFKTLKEGIPGSAMSSFATLPTDQRWALVHFVLSLGPTPPKDTADDLAKVGFGPKAASGGGSEEKSIPMELAMERMAKEEAGGSFDESKAPESHGRSREESLVAFTYTSRCAQCHGIRGEGGVRVRNLGVNPKAYVTTRKFTSQSESFQSFEAFSLRVRAGLPGDLMPAYGQFSMIEMQELYQFVRTLSASSSRSP